MTIYVIDYVYDQRCAYSVSKKALALGPHIIYKN